MWNTVTSDDVFSRKVHVHVRVCEEVPTQAEAIDNCFVKRSTAVSETTSGGVKRTRACVSRHACAYLGVRVRVHVRALIYKHEGWERNCKFAWRSSECHPRNVP